MPRTTSGDGLVNVLIPPGARAGALTPCNVGSVTEPVLNVRDAIALLKSKAGEDEVEAYRQFVLSLVNKVAEARKEGFMGLSGDRVSLDEKAAIEEVTGALA